MFWEILICRTIYDLIWSKTRSFPFINDSEIEQSKKRRKKWKHNTTWSAVGLVLHETEEKTKSKLCMCMCCFFAPSLSLHLIRALSFHAHSYTHSAQPHVHTSQSACSKSPITKGGKNIMSVNATINQCHTENQSNVCTIPFFSISPSFVSCGMSAIAHFDWFFLCTKNEHVALGRHRLYVLITICHIATASFLFLFQRLFSASPTHLFGCQWNL